MLPFTHMNIDLKPIQITATTIIDGGNLMDEIETVGLPSPAWYQIHHLSSSKAILESFEK
jgi:hypothetical protein